MNPTVRMRNLLVMALADGSLGEREVNFLTDRCVEMGLGEDELRDALRFALEDGAQIELPSDPQEAESLLADMLRMMAADGSLDESEKRLFAVCAAKLGLGLPEIDALVDRLLRK
jgi:uncharacterized membrane protein YebE (DUF533 family)